MDRFFLFLFGQGLTCMSWNCILPIFDIQCDIHNLNLQTVLQSFYFLWMPLSFPQTDMMRFTCSHSSCVANDCKSQIFSFQVIFARIKNLMDPAHDSNLSAGYRNVSVTTLPSLLWFSVSPKITFDGPMCTGELSAQLAGDSCSGGWDTHLWSAAAPQKYGCH